MSRLFLMFLIALLPLRSWSVQGMVMQMGMATVAVSSPVLERDMGDDCALHMQQVAAAQAEASPQEDAQLPAGHKAQHKGCQSCQLCMPLAALQASDNVALASTAQCVPMRGSSRFVSADRARDAKPPIS